FHCATGGRLRSGSDHHRIVVTHGAMAKLLQAARALTYSLQTRHSSSDFGPTRFETAGCFRSARWMISVADRAAVQ
ncbi:MAG TPA: hypothetical protein VK638_53910, partial [Edaphobacter sp.]|nr:hypothetical protein [Edaphobacter sp.]